MLARYRAVIALAAYVVLLLVHLGTLLAGQDPWAMRTQWLLMPVLVVVVLTSPALTTAGGGNRLVRLTLAALAFSWLGDLLPDLVSPQAAFGVLIAAFAVAQGCYAYGFWPYREHSVVGRPAMYAYVVVAVALVLLCAPGAGEMLAPLLGYAVLITMMAILSTGVHRIVTVGALLFVASDALIAMSAFVDGWQLADQDFWVMLTYGLAQLLIVLGVLSHTAASVSENEPLAAGLPETGGSGR